jgi:hypothetical protein
VYQEILVPTRNLAVKKGKKKADDRHVSEAIEIYQTKANVAVAVLAKLLNHDFSTFPSSFAGQGASRRPTL